ncbi:hypothetical protein SMICM17S_04690 [Streptomyces microflavus]
MPRLAGLPGAARKGCGPRSEQRGRWPGATELPAALGCWPAVRRGGAARPTRTLGEVRLAGGDRRVARTLNPVRAARSRTRRRSAWRWAAASAPTPPSRDSAWASAARLGPDPAAPGGEPGAGRAAAGEDGSAAVVAWGGPCRAVAGLRARRSCGSRSRQRRAAVRLGVGRWRRHVLDRARRAGRGGLAGAGAGLAEVDDLLGAVFAERTASTRTPAPAVTSRTRSSWWTASRSGRATAGRGTATATP